MKNGGSGMLSILGVLSKKLNIWKEKYGVMKIGLFGSYNFKEQKESSDIDILVEFNNPNLTFDN